MSLMLQLGVHVSCSQAREKAGIQVQDEEMVRCRATLAAGHSSCSAGAIHITSNTVENCTAGQPRCSAPRMTPAAGCLPYRGVRICCHASRW